MERVQEPTELMSDDEQAHAYAEADFSEPDNNFIRQFGERFPDYDGSGRVLDLGCGPGNITRRFALRYAGAQVDGVDGSAAMLHYGRKALASDGEAIASRITFVEGFIPGVALPADVYEVIVSNSLLHHLPDPQALWTTIKTHSTAGTRVFVADLYRPTSREIARQIVETYSADEPEVLKTDFFNSLLAAFTPAEIGAQLAAAGLSHFSVQAIDDRHVVVSGVMA
ncbi:MAG: methyltransferase domain-containing protein [Chloroflexi bacterium]|nr:methyltransferase domain-containing protein [Chloroflexota bacterium]